MKPPRVTEIDILRAFVDGDEQPQTRRQRRLAQHADRAGLLARFKEHWAIHVGNVCSCPSDSQIFRWMKIGRLDMLLLLASIEDLGSRAKYGMDPYHPYKHCLNHYTAALIRRVRGKFGERKAA